MKAAVVAAIALLAAQPAVAVDRSKFRKCSDAGFCKRHRGKASEPELRLMSGSTKLAGPGQLTAVLHSDAPGAPLFDLNVYFYESGIARMRLTENIADKPPRWEVRCGRRHLLADSVRVVRCPVRQLPRSPQLHACL